MAQICELYVGTYTCPIRFGTGEIMKGKGKGILHLSIDTVTGMIQEVSKPIHTVNPSFVMEHPKKRYLYAVNETKWYNGQEGGSLSAFSIKNKELIPCAEEATLGSDPCHVAVSPDGKCAIVSNFMSGSVTVFPIAEDGVIQPHSQFFQHKGHSVHPIRQCGPHAHAAVFSPDGRFLLVPDLGLDKLMIYRYQDGALAFSHDYAMKAGSGPRYCEFHPRLPICYVINELSSSISALLYNSETAMLAHRETHSTLRPPYDGENICADLHISADGRYLYGSNRGANTIVLFELDEQGGMHYRQTVACGGRTPRNFALIPGGKWLVAANQDSDDLAVFRIDQRDGSLKQVSSFPVMTPVCVRPREPDAGAKDGE